MNYYFFFNDTATTEIYTLSLHDALPISPACSRSRHATMRATTAPPRTRRKRSKTRPRTSPTPPRIARTTSRSEEHTSELQSRQYLVCRLLLEKKKILPVTHLLTTFDANI